MKKLFLALALIIPLFSFANSKARYIPVWYAEQPVRDSALTESESLFEFHFSFLDYGGDDHRLSTTKLVYSNNGKMDSIGFLSGDMMSLKAKPGNYIFQFYVGPYYREVKTDSIGVKGGFKTIVHINFKSTVNPIKEDKPVIYVYSDQPQPVNLQMNISGKMGFTYPAYNDGWNFIADKNGNLSLNGKTYPYLFWEAQTDVDYADIDWQNGSIVQRDSLVPFFEKNLAAMGMNEKEITDYITYWVPQMQKNEISYVHFILNEDYDAYATMNITPAPDAKFQVFMLWTSANTISNMELTPQHFSPFSRKGLTVVEWGGGELPCAPAFQL